VDIHLTLSMMMSAGTLRLMTEFSVCECFFKKASRISAWGTVRGNPSNSQFYIRRRSRRR